MSNLLFPQVNLLSLAFNSARKKSNWLVCTLLVPASILSAQVKTPKKAVAGWSAKSFNNFLFVENKSQFDGADKLPDSKILYGMRQDGAEIYFSTKGYTYRHTELVPLPEREREKLEKKGIEAELISRVKTDSMSMEWVGANPNVQVIAENKATNYFTYPDLKGGANKTILANGYSKITYKNLYPGIDVVYTLPEGKPGVKYSLIVHPGADPSRVKMAYANNTKPSLNSEGDLNISTLMGRITDHAPKSTSADGSSVPSRFVIEKNQVGFNLGNYDNTKTLIIDPWMTVPSFTGNTKAFDVDFDNAGNVYIYGGNFPFQEEKFNSAGTLQWTYTSSAFSNSYYGDFAVDGHSQCSYLTEGFNPGGARIIKVGPGGLQLGILPQNANMIEMWRIVYNTCSHSSVIAGGGTSQPYQACMLDSNVTTITPVNVLGATTALHDFALLAQDNSNMAYMATAQSVVYPTVFDNVMLQTPIPALSPNTYMVSDGFAFHEVGSVSYASGPPNGFNGMAVSPNFLYTYDGQTLKEWNKNTGALINSVVVGGSSFTSGGITVDNCDDIFVGNGTNIIQYNSSLATVGSPIAATSTVYDVRLGNNNQLYACGNGFVQEFTTSLVCGSGLSLTTTNTTACSNTNTATVTPTGGTGPYTYSWSTSPVQTTATATGLSPGTYYVMVTDASCVPLHQLDSVTIVASSAPVLTLTANTAICNGDNVALSVSGATTYTWSPAAGLSSTTSATPTATPTVTTTYTVVGTTGACSTTQTVTITVNPIPTVTASPNDTICQGGQANLSASGATTYSWTPSAGLSSTTIANPVATPTVTTTYTVTGTSSGCTNTATVMVTVSPNPNPVVTGSPNVLICNGSSTPLSFTGATTYTWSPSAGLSSTTIPNPVASPTVTTTYTVTGRNGSCTATATVTVRVDSTMTLTPTSQHATCGNPNGSASIAVASGGIPTFTYSWSSGQTTSSITNVPAGTYTVTVKDSNNCSQSSVIVITQPAPLTATTAVATPISCNGGSNGSVTATGGGGTAPYTYSWNTVPPQTTATATGLPAGTYTVTIKDSNNCVTTHVITLTQPTALTDSVHVAGCDCGATNGSAIVYPIGGTGPYTYSWNSTPPQTTATANNLPVGSFTVHVTDSRGCFINVAAVVPQLPGVQASFTANPTSGPVPLTVQFNNTSSAGTYMWFFGDNTTSTSTNPSHEYMGKGTYDAILVVTNSFGCTATDSVTIIVGDSAHLMIPNIFTPNGDGNNDVFFITNVGYETIECTIYDRWGVKIYEWNGLNGGWDGKTKSGNLASDGVYYYVANATPIGGKAKSYAGFIQLVSGR